MEPTDPGEAPDNMRDMMGLEVVVFGFSGVIIRDERIHLRVLNQILVEENLPPVSTHDAESYRQIFLGRSNAERFQYLWHYQGRVLPPALLNSLIQRKQAYYQQTLSTLNRLPLVPGLVEAIQEIQRLGFGLGLVTGWNRQEVNYLLSRCKLNTIFDPVITAETLPIQEPFAKGSLYRQLLQNLNCPPETVVAVEATYEGIEAAKSAGITVIGLASLFPYQMIQRRADWAVDYFRQIEWQRLKSWLATGSDRKPMLSMDGNPSAQS